MERSYTPSDIHRLCGVNPETLRNWRRSEYALDVGEYQSNGRWTYNISDLIVFAFVRQIEALGVTLPDAFGIAIQNSPAVHQHVVAQTYEWRDPNRRPDILVCWPRALAAEGKAAAAMSMRDGGIVQSLGGGTMLSARVHDANDFLKFVTYGAIVFDLEHVAKHLPSALLAEAHDAAAKAREALDRDF